MVSELASSAIDRRFAPQSGQTKENKIDICCFSAKNTCCPLADILTFNRQIKHKLCKGSYKEHAYPKQSPVLEGYPFLFLS